jgi:hypothetical protein
LDAVTDWIEGIVNGTAKSMGPGTGLWGMLVESYYDRRSEGDPSPQMRIAFTITIVLSAAAVIGDTVLKQLGFVSKKRKATAATDKLD